MLMFSGTTSRLLGPHSVPERLRPVSSRLSRSLALQLCVNKTPRRAADPASSDPRFSIGLARRPLETPRFAATQAMAGFGAAVHDARRPAGEHHEHSGARPAARGDVLPFF